MDSNVIATTDLATARELALQYHCEFVDLEDF
jgi:hypothetical protein